MKKAKKKATNGVDSRTVRISQEVWDRIAKDAKDFREPVDAILRRKYGLPEKPHWTKR